MILGDRAQGVIHMEDVMDQGKKCLPFKATAESFESFKDKGLYYIDKTGFIPYILNKGDDICVITRPRRFGKTLMMRMLQTFFEYKLDDKSNPIDNRRYFEGLKVMDAGEDVLKEMGRYPVISLSLKGMRNDTLKGMRTKLQSALSAACDEHSYLLDHPALQDFEHEQFRQILSKSIDQENLEDALGNLCSWIYKATKRKTVILLDEYDVPLQNAAIHDIKNPSDNLFDKTVSLVGNFIASGFKSNSNLAYGIIAGCMRVAKESIFTGMNNPGVITVLDDIPEEFWGFSEDEVKTMLAYYGIEHWYARIEEWYDGYEYSGRKVFNPWSLLNAIRGLVNGSGEKAIQAYWGMTSGNDIIDEMIERNPQHREALARLMDGTTMTVPVVDNISYRDLQKNPDAIWSFLLYTGYLKPVKVARDEDNLKFAEVAIPNTEIYTIMKGSLQSWWKNTHLARYDARPLMQALWKGDMPGIQREINGIMNDSISVKDAKEDFYHGMLVGVLRTQCEVKSNRESGEGYPDIVAIDGNRAAIIELKCLLSSVLDKLPMKERYSKTPAMMQELLDKAEEQIRTRYYVEGLRFEKPLVTEVKSYAICFCKKMCMVREVTMG